jgi:hypothetical protein
MSQHWQVVSLARAWGCTPNEILAHDDRMIHTMRMFLRWEQGERAKAQRSKRR